MTDHRPELPQTAHDRNDSADALAVVFQTTVPTTRDNGVNYYSLKHFQEMFTERVEQLAGNPRPPWYRLIRRWRDTLITRQLARDIAQQLIHERVSVLVHLHCFSGLQDRRTASIPGYIEALLADPNWVAIIIERKERERREKERRDELERYGKQRPNPTPHENYHFDRAIKGYPRQGYMAPPID